MHKAYKPGEAPAGLSINSYAKLVKAEKDCHTIEITEKATGKEGVANTKNGMVQVFYGSDDGSDDKTITPEEFNANFEITRMIKNNYDL